MTPEPVKCFMVEVLDEDERGRFRLPSGEVVRAVHELPPGAIYVADWLKGYGSVNGDGLPLVVILPNGHDWMPGTESNNCTRKGEDHDCWCVHGEAPKLTVDKSPEPGRSTCEAGAGSILSGKWHGFLRDGYLVI